MAAVVLVYAALFLWAAAAFGRPTRWLTLFTWALPFHVLAVAALYGFWQLPMGTVRLIAAWKETAVLLAAATVAVRLLAGRVERLTFTATDAAVGAFALLSVIYFVGENPLLNAGLPMVAQLYGLRDSAFFTVLYFVGRATPEVASDRTLRRLVAVGALTSVVAIVERIFVSPDLLVLIGASTYYQEFLQIEEFTVNNEYGLVDNYWTRIGGSLVRRAGSVYLSPMNFAIVFVLIVPAATLLLFSRRRGWRPGTWLAYGTIWAGLLITITRASIAAAALEVLLIAFLLGRPALFAGLATAGAGAFAVALAVVPNLASFVWQTLTWQTGSSESHLEGWSRGLNTMVTHPLGTGLSSADAGLRFGLTPVSSDNTYLKYGAELGVLGLAAVVVMFAAIGAAGATLAHTATDPAHRRWGIFIVTATVGIAFNAVTITILNTQMLSYLFFWMAGSAVTLSRRGAPAAQGR